MKEIRLANKIIRTLIKDHIQYPGRLIVDTVGVVARCGVLLILYWYVFGLNNGTINGSTYIVAAWSMFFYFSFSALRLRDISKLIMRDVQSGAVDVLFSKPISYLAYRTWWQIGSGLYSFTVIAIAGAVVLAFFIGFPQTMALGLFIPTLFLVIIFGSLLSLLVYIIVGLLAFQIDDINPVYWIVDKAVMILGGSYLPVALFSPLMYKLALYSPFGASQFITHTVYASWQFDWYRLIGLQLFWICSLGIVVYFMFARARIKVSVNGG